LQFIDGTIAPDGRYNFVQIERKDRMIFARSRKSRSTRKSVQQAAWLVFDGSFAARQCTVVDLSDSGAKVETSEASPVGTKLRLAFSRDVRTGRPCEVVWRRGKTIGVKFI
jgi:hypothetical protein